MDERKEMFHQNKRQHFIALYKNYGYRLAKKLLPLMQIKKQYPALKLLAMALVVLEKYPHQRMDIPKYRRSNR